MTKEYGHLEMIPPYSHIIKYGKIEIGEYTFIEARATILSGVKIGDHCVIGAGSLVNKDIPYGTIVAGVPARFICVTEDYAQICLNSMPLNFDKAQYLKHKKQYLVDYYMK